MQNEKRYVIIIRPREESKKKLWLPEDGLFELQSLVGGDIETVPTDREDFLLVVNNEGKIDGLRYNKKATGILNSFIKKRDCICGTAVLMKRAKENLEGFSAAEVERWLGRLN